MDALTFDLTAAYTDAQLTKTSCGGTLSYDSASFSCLAPGGPCQPIATDGDALLGAPWSFTASAEYHFPEWSGPHALCAPRLSALDRSEIATSGTRLEQCAVRHHPPGLPVLNNLSLAPGLRFNGFDMSAYANNVTNAHPLMFAIPRHRALARVRRARGPVRWGRRPIICTSARGVRPLTIGRDRHLSILREKNDIDSI